MELIIAEKPSVGMTIAKVVGAKEKSDGYMKGNGYIVSWCVGHLISLEDPDYYIMGKKDTDKKIWNIEELPIIPDMWQFRLPDDKGLLKQFNVLKKLMFSDKVDAIVCATDAGREGECIFRYVYNFVKCNKFVKRLWVSSLEESAIKEGLKCMKPDSDYDNLFESGLARAKADWLIGMNMSRLYSVKYQARPVLSVGRVQTPTLAMIVDRYDKIKGFVKEYYYRIELETEQGFSLKSEEKYNSEREAEEILKNTGEYGTVTDFKKKNQKTNPPTLFDLTLLQREANRQLGYTAQETLDLLQKLYEAKYVTYPRTDSKYITDDMEDTAKELVALLNSLKLYYRLVDDTKPNIKCLINNKKVSDHHALLPTRQVKDEVFHTLPEKQANILRLICGRLLVATSTARECFKSKAVVETEGRKYIATGNTVINEGFKAIEDKVKIYSKEVNNEKKINIPELSVGEKIHFLNKNVVEQETKPLQLYNDDTLLKAMETAGNEDYEPGMEKKGIGTPATRAGILETLVSRGYIERVKKSIIPTERGINLIQLLPDVLKSAKTTATWETALQQIETGEVSPEYFMEKIEGLTKKLTQKGKEENADTSIFAKQKFADCPKCGGAVVSYPKAVKCEKCEFIIFKTVAGKKVSDNQLKKLFERGKTDKIKGFKNKEGKEFEAKLILNNDFKIEFTFK